MHRVHSAVVYVNVAQTNNVPDGQSWPTAFKTVREAIQAASNGDAVWVAAGTYSENLKPSNISKQSIAGKSYFLDWSVNLTSLPAFVTLQSNIVGTAGMTSYTNSNISSLTPSLYRVGVRP